MSEITCPQCRRMIEADSRFCRYCAFDLKSPSVASEKTVTTTNQPQNSSIKPLLLVGGGALCLVLIIAAVVIVRGRKPSSVDQASTSASTVTTATMSDRAKQLEEKILRGETLTESDIAGLSAYELRILRNVHFARYGRSYEKSAELSAYFNSRPWYKPNDAYSDSMITSNDKANISLIQSEENKLRVPNKT